jgi:hypothetical protein
MSSTSIRLYRLLLIAYPAEFRRHYRAEMVQLMLDQRRHGARATWRILLTEAFDVARTAPQMRWESTMNRVVIIAVVATVAIAALLTRGALMLIPLGIIALAAWLLWGRRLTPIAPAPSSRRWVRWLAAGGAAIAIGIAIPQIDGGELSALWWTVMAVAVVGGIVLAAIAILLAVSDRAHRLASTQLP